MKRMKWHQQVSFVVEIIAFIAAIVFMVIGEYATSAAFWGLAIYNHLQVKSEA